MAENTITFTSLCRVEEHPNENIDACLYRCADIKNGILVQTDSQNIKFADSHYIYRKNIEQKVGTYGIWNWTVEPNQNNPDRPYFHSWFNCSPIEILYFPKFFSTEDLVEKILKYGFKKQLVSDRILLCIPRANGTGIMEGVYCSADDLLIERTNVKIKDTIPSLPCCNLYTKDLFSVSDNYIADSEKHFFYKYLTITTTHYIPVMNPMEVVQEIVQEQFAWKTAQKQNISRSEWQKLRAFLKDIYVESILDEISKKYHCSLEDSKRYIDLFVDNADKYVDHTGINEEIISGIISNHPTLTSKFEKAIEEKWQAENQKTISATMDENNKLMEKVEKEKAFLSEIEQRTKSLNEQNENLALEIAEKEELLLRVEEKISSRLQEARQDVSGLLASFPFINMGNNIARGTENNFPQPENMRIYTPGEKLVDNDIDTYDQWDNLFDILLDGLNEASVLKSARAGFAAFLYAAYLNNVPVFLIGPNAEAIANAFSVSLFGNFAGVMDCSEDYSASAVNSMFTSNDKVIAIKNIFNHGWLQHIPDIVSHREKFFFILHPFTEDILVEPPSIFNYAVPIFTEPLVEDAPTNQFFGGIPSEKFEHPALINQKNGNDKLLEKMGGSRLFRNQVQKILNTFSIFYEDKDDEIKCLLAYLPIAYIYGNGELLMEEKSKIISSDTRKEISSFLRLQDE